MMIRDQERMKEAVRNALNAWLAHAQLPTYELWKVLEKAMGELEEVRKEVDLQR